MRITGAQLNILASYYCERLSENSDNYTLISDFYNSKNNSLVDTLQGEAYSDDENNRLAYYVIKDKSDNIMMFFSLKCGLLYDEFYEGDRLKEMKACYDRVLSLSKDSTLSKDSQKAVSAILESIRSKKGFKREEVARVLHLSEADEEIDHIFAKNLKNVGVTFPGVEIVHLCANDACRELWNKNMFPQKMATTFFWYFIVPKVQELMKIAGCEYLFLFAADLTEDATLVSYYTENMGFELADEHCAAIPMYDFTCQFMSQKTSELAARRQTFFDNFIPEE